MLVVGSYVSPYVRKVLACLALKGLAYDIDPITPFYGDEQFTRLSPLRRIPVLVDGDVVIADSSVICAHLDERYPARPLLPADPADRARARWLEEFADSRMGEVFIWRMFYPLAVGPAVFGDTGDAAAVEHNRAHDVPAVLDYLESQLPAQGWLFGEIGLADVAVAAFFRNAGFVNFQVDAERWPKTSSFVERALAHPALAALHEFEALNRRTGPGRLREALAEAGAPISAASYGQPVPRRGVMKL